MSPRDRFLYPLYKGATNLAFAAAGPLRLVLGTAAERRVPGLSERFGHYAVGPVPGRPRVWFHAVSVGETHVAQALFKALTRRWPNMGAIVSTVTAAGLSQARELFGPDAACVYAPADFPVTVRRALSHFSPDMVIFLETELWPNWMVETARRGVPAMLANGRISERTIGRYLSVRPLFARALSGLDAFCMIGAADAQRIVSLGADPDKVRVTGNAKVDVIAEKADPAAAARMADLLGAGPGRLVFVAGSTRRGEEGMILDAFSRILDCYPQALCVLAPRHVQRAYRLVAKMNRRGLSHETLSSVTARGGPARAPIVLVDSMGRLFDIYGTATVVFCGASLVPLGGQNPLEPAAWGRPVLFGPHMQDFADAARLLVRQGGATVVSDAVTLSQAVDRLFSDPQAARDVGERARSVCAGLSGAAEKCAATAQALLSGRSHARVHVRGR